MMFFVSGEPKPKGSMRAFIPKGWKRPVLTSAAGAPLKLWHQCVAACAMQSRKPQMIEDAVRIKLIFQLVKPKSAKKRLHPTVKPDLDKLVRATLDPLVGILIRDDSQVIQLEAKKKYIGDGENQGCWVAVLSESECLNP